MCARKRAGSRIPRISSISISITSEFKNCPGHRRAAAEDTIDSGMFQRCKGPQTHRWRWPSLHYMYHGNIFVEVTFDDSKENMRTHNTRETNITVVTRLVKGLLLIIML